MLIVYREEEKKNLMEWKKLSERERIYIKFELIRIIITVKICIVHICIM